MAQKEFKKESCECCLMTKNKQDEKIRENIQSREKRLNNSSKSSFISNYLRIFPHWVELCLSHNLSNILESKSLCGGQNVVSHTSQVHASTSSSCS